MNASDTVLITGASGFVGSAVARAVKRRGPRIRVLVRATSPRANLAGLNTECIEGDMLDPDSLARALHGVRYLFHVAADYRLWALKPAEIERTNVAGTELVMRAALRAGVERIVYTSSVATLDVSQATDAINAMVDETAPLDAARAIGAYKRSKVLAERLVERLIAEAGLPAVIVNPSAPVGPRDIKPTPTGRMIVEAARGRMPVCVDTGLNLVHVDDVAEGQCLALTHGQIGERYILGGDNVTLRQLLIELAQLTGRRPPIAQLPRWPLYPFAYAAEKAARFTKREPLITVDALKLASYRMFFSSAKAERELGYRARPYQEGLRDALAWFSKAGYLS